MEMNQNWYNQTGHRDESFYFADVFSGVFRFGVFVSVFFGVFGTVHYTKYAEKYADKYAKTKYAGKYVSKIEGLLCFRLVFIYKLRVSISNLQVSLLSNFKFLIIFLAMKGTSVNLQTRDVLLNTNTRDNTRHKN